MLDFYDIKTDFKYRNRYCEIYPTFKVGGFNDLMIRGRSFYAVWNPEINMWSTDENDVWRIIDKDIYKVASEIKDKHPGYDIIIKTLNDSSSGMWDKFQKHIKNIPDRYKLLDTSIVFSNVMISNNKEISVEDIDKKKYISKKLDYSLEKMDIKAYDELMCVLYDEDNRQKLEWAIGSIIAGDSKNIQKFIVLYGGPGTGKSTVLHIIEKLFDGYYIMFNAKDLVTKNNQFAMEQFSTNPLVAIQHDGDLSKINDNSLLNSLISHEKMRINAKFKSPYTDKINSFLFMASNSTVGMTSINSGLKRRCIEVNPTGEKIPPKKFSKLEKQIEYELGGIAYHCYQVYKSLGIDAYKNVLSNSMLGRTNYIYNYFQDNIDDIILLENKDKIIKLNDLYRSFKNFCSDIGLEKPINRLKFREEAENYFKEYHSELWIDRNHYRNIFIGFKKEIFTIKEKKREFDDKWIKLKKQPSILDEYLSNCKAQYADDNEKPTMKWDNVKTVLNDLDTKKTHYVRPPSNHIVIDFDLKDNNEKSLSKNLEIAEKLPPTYVEVSKSGNGLHLHYNYLGNVDELSSVFDENIEIKKFTGKSSLRRKLSLCNNIKISDINSGLPLKKGGNNLINFKNFNDEKHLRNFILKNLKKEIHGSTKPSVDFIFKALNEAYESGMSYDVRDLRHDILVFATNSTNQSDTCVKLVNKMKFYSDDNDIEKNTSLIFNDDKDISNPIVFFDVEVFPNLFLINWKYKGDDSPVVRMINPLPEDVERLVKESRLIGFNNRRYDNHILYARMMGYNNYKLFELSQKIVKGSKNAMFGGAYNLSYTDVYDFSSAGNKKSLKKWEIELGLHHKELGYEWDKPVPKDKWTEVAEYCDNDVISTEKVFDHLQADWETRKILSDLSGLSVNHSTNAHSTKIMFGDDPNPQKEFIYTDLSKEFPGYIFENGKSYYKGIEVGEGGCVIAEPGMYYDVPVLDISSMHPSTIEYLNLFGDRYTKRFVDIKNSRLYIKHNEIDLLSNMLDGKLNKLIPKIKKDKNFAESLANAFKTVINAIYGLTAAKFDNKFKDPRNIDNIVAKRGALFMIDLKEEVENQGYKVIHIKTDSIKIANADNHIINFIMEYGKKRGYNFEHESTYDKMCLINKSTYISKYATKETCNKLYGYIPDKNNKKSGKWDATGAEFQVPFVFKTLFSKEPIEFEDLCETKSVTSSIYLDMNEGLEDVSELEKEKEKIIKKASKEYSTLEEIYNNYPELIEMDNKIKNGHNYIFVGKVGSFCPIKEGFGGGVLYRLNNGKYDSISGTKGYRWLESEVVKEKKKENDINRNYYIKLVDEAKDEINKFGDYELFVN